MFRRLEFAARPCSLGVLLCFIALTPLATVAQQSESGSPATRIREAILADMRANRLPLFSSKKPPIIVFPLTSKRGDVTPFGVQAAQQIASALLQNSPDFSILDSTRMNPLVKGRKVFLEDLRTPEASGLVADKYRALFAVGGTYESVPEGVNLRITLYRSASKSTFQAISARIPRNAAVEELLAQPSVRQRSAHPAESRAPACVGPTPLKSPTTAGYAGETKNPGANAETKTGENAKTQDGLQSAINAETSAQPRLIGKGMTEPKCKSCPDPSYTEEARTARYDATMLLNILVTTEGKVARIFVVKRAALGLDYQAINTVRKWRLKPGLDESNRPIPVCVDVEVVFRVL